MPIAVHPIHRPVEGPATREQYVTAIAVMSEQHIETIRTPGQSVAYALVRDDVACELTIRRAIALQREGVPYVASSPLRAWSDFATFYPEII